MTIGPGLLVLALFRKASDRVSRAIVTIGRVPFLYYVVHIFLIHAVAVVAATFALGESSWLFTGMPVLSRSEGYAFSLQVVYLMWAGVVVTLYPVCRWFAGLKQQRRDWWLSYL